MTKIDGYVVDLAVELIATRQNDSFVRAAVGHALGDYNAETADAHIAAAREKIRKDLARDPEEHRAESVALLRVIIRDPNAKPTDRLRAQDQLARLLGLLGDEGAGSPESRARELREFLRTMDNLIEGGEG